MNRKRKMKRKQEWNMIMYGFKFRILDCDYDFTNAKSINYKYSKRLWERAMNFKEAYSCDFNYCEFDCTGSRQIRIKVYRKRSKMYIRYHEIIDV